MDTNKQIFKVNTPHIVHDTIDNETILFNIKTGHYYSFDKLGVVIWNAIINHYSLSALSEELASYYKTSVPTIMEAAEDFVAQLLKEDLIKPQEDTRTESNKPELLLTENLDTTFAPPVLNKYTNMQDMLLLDPIHDTGEKGWPSGKEEFEE